MNNLVQRTIFGSLFIIVVVGAILGGQHVFASLFLLISLVCVFEFFKLIDVKEARPQKLLTYILAVVTYSLMYLTAAKLVVFPALLFIIPFIIAVYVIELFRKEQFPLTNIALTFLPVIYIVLPFGMLHYIAFYDYEYTKWMLLSIFILQWTSDTGAYVVGMLIGKHKLFPRISPKKSWEGYIGGIVITIGMAWALGYFTHVLCPCKWTAFAIIISVVSPLGDFVESLFKRTADIKDSGQLIPGHGGLLDRFDAFMFSVPLILAYLFIFAYLI